MSGEGGANGHFRFVVAVAAKLVDVGAVLCSRDCLCAMEKAETEEAPSENRASMAVVSFMIKARSGV